MRELREQAEKLGLSVQPATNDSLAKLVGDVSHQGAVAVVRALQALDETALMAMLEGIEGDALLLVLDGVTDPHNLGACLRTADAAGDKSQRKPAAEARSRSRLARRGNIVTAALRAD